MVLWAGQTGTTQLWAQQVAGRMDFLLRTHEKAVLGLCCERRMLRHPAPASQLVKRRTTKSFLGVWFFFSSRANAGRRSASESAKGQARDGASPPAARVNAVQRGVSSSRPPAVAWPLGLRR